MTKKEIFIDDKNLILEDFSCLWCSIAKNIDFFKLYKNSNFDLNLKKINQNISKLSPKNKTKSFNNHELYINYNNYNNERFYEKIYENEQYVILMNGSWSYGDIIVLRDNLQLNRYFIGFSYECGTKNINVCGIIIYFNANGLTSLTNNKIIPYVLCSNYYNDGELNLSTLSAFYNQTLIFGNLFSYKIA